MLDLEGNFSVGAPELFLPALAAGFGKAKGFRSRPGRAGVSTLYLSRLSLRRDASLAALTPLLLLTGIGALRLLIHADRPDLDVMLARIADDLNGGIKTRSKRPTICRWSPARGKAAFAG